MKFRLVTRLAVALTTTPFLLAMSLPAAEPGAVGQMRRARPALLEPASTAAPAQVLRARVALAEPDGDGTVSQSAGNRLRRLVQ